jgi:hypothetical protein
MILPPRVSRIPTSIPKKWKNFYEVNDDTMHSNQYLKTAFKKSNKSYSASKIFMGKSENAW